VLDLTSRLLPGTGGAAATPAGPSADPLDALALAARDGDLAAFNTLYAVTAPSVYRYCYVRTRHHADAEDLLQQTFLRVVEALPRYEDRGLPFRAWLFRVCRTVAIDASRRRRVHEALDDEAELADPETHLMVGADLLREDLLDALEHLTDDQRAVIQLRFFADLSARDAGLAMGRDEAAVRALQARAIAALRRRLDVAEAPVLSQAVTA
jgi:RNA polymerase sigma-70 factor (ECF subfamily)